MRAFPECMEDAADVPCRQHANNSCEHSNQLYAHLQASNITDVVLLHHGLSRIEVTRHVASALSLSGVTSHACDAHQTNPSGHRIGETSVHEHSGDNGLICRPPILMRHSLCTACSTWACSTCFKKKVSRIYIRHGSAEASSAIALQPEQCSKFVTSFNEVGGHHITGSIDFRPL